MLPEHRCSHVYPRGMSSNPGDLTPGYADLAGSMQGAELGSGAARPGDPERSMGARRLEQRDERCGPLAITRYLKDDGRSLLLYRHLGGRRA